MSKLGKLINGSHALYVGVGFAFILLGLLGAGFKILWRFINGSVRIGWEEVAIYLAVLIFCSLIAFVLLRIGYEELRNWFTSK